MSPRGNAQTEYTSYSSEYHDDPDSPSNRMRRGAEDFFEKLRDLGPRSGQRSQGHPSEQVHERPGNPGTPGAMGIPTHPRQRLGENRTFQERQRLALDPERPERTRHLHHRVLPPEHAEPHPPRVPNRRPPAGRAAGHTPRRTVESPQGRGETDRTPE